MTRKAVSVRPTLRDVAKIAGVDPSLVSRVVNNDTSFSIPDATRTKILDAVDKVGYRPNAAARGLRTQKSFTLGLVIPDLSNPVYAPIVAGAQGRASDAGYSVLLASEMGGNVPGMTSALTRMLEEGRVDGLLVASGDKNSELLPVLAQLSKPFVLMNRAVPGMSSVVADDEGGATVATAHLISNGHAALAHLAGPRGQDTSARRRKGFQAAVKAAGLPSPAVISSKGWGVRDGYAAGKRLLAEATPTAVFAANVTLAIGFYRAAHEHGLSIPQDVSVCALHDYDFAGMLVPSLTTVRMPLAELGRVAVDVLLRDMAGETRVVVVDGPVELIERESVRSI